MPASTPASSVSAALLAGAPDASAPPVLRANDRLLFRIAEDPVRGATPMRLGVNSLGEASFPISPGFRRSHHPAGAGEDPGPGPGRDLREADGGVLPQGHRGTGHGREDSTPGKVQFFGEVQTVIALSPDQPPLKLSDAILQVRAPEFANLKRVKIHRLNATTDRPRSSRSMSM